MQGAAGAESCLARGRNGGLLHPGLGQTQLATGGRQSSQRRISSKEHV